MKTRLEKTQAARSLTTTLAVAFLLLSVAVLVISGSLQIFFNFQTQQQATASKLQLIAQDATRRVSNFIQEKVSVLDTTTSLVDLADASPQAQTQILQGLLGRQPALRQLILLNGQDQISAQASRISQLTAGRPIERLQGEPLTQLRQGKNYISSVYIDSVTSEPLVLIAVPEVSVMGGFEGTLVAELNLKFMWDLVDQLEVGETGAAYVVDRQGNLLAYRDTARVLKGENVRQMPEVDQFVSGISSTNVTPSSLSRGIEGTNVVASYYPLGTPDWAVVTELPWQEAYHDIIQNTAATGLILLIMAVFAGLVGVYEARQLTVPLVGLTTTVNRIDAGELDLQAQMAGPSEVASLATAFNSMTAKLRNLIGSLEQRVAERTVALERYSNYLVALQDTTLDLVSQLDLNELLQATITRAARLVGTEHGSVFMLDPHTGEMKMRVGIGTYANLVNTQAKSGVGLAGTVWQSGAPLVVEDYQNWPGRLAGRERSQLQSVIGVPLKSGNQTVGVIGLASLDRAQKFGKDEVEILGRFAQLASIALGNARLYTEQATLAAENRRLLDRAQRAAEENRQLFEQAQQAAVENRQLLEREQKTSAENSRLLVLSEKTAEENRQLFERAQQAVQELNALTRRLTGEGWEEYLAAQQQTIVVEDVLPQLSDQHDLTLVERAVESASLVKSSNGHSAVALPIILRGQVIGSVALEDLDPGREWGENDLSLMEQVTDRMALALDNARLYAESQQELAERTRAEAETHRRNEQLAALNRIGQALTKIAEPGEIAETILTTLDQVLDAPYFYLALYDQDRQWLSFYTRAKERYNVESRPFAEGLTEYVIRSRKPMLISADMHATYEKLGIVPVGRASKSYMGVPMLAGERVLGVIALQDFEREHAYSTADVELLSTIAAQATAAFENARLFGQTQAMLSATRQRAEREQKIAAITDQVHKSTEVDAILRIAAEELRRTTGSTRAVVWLRQRQGAAASKPGPALPQPAGGSQTGEGDN